MCLLSLGNKQLHCEHKTVMAEQDSVYCHLSMPCVVKLISLDTEKLCLHR